MLPLAVVTAVPFALFVAIFAIWLRGLAVDLYFQIGMLVLIGLAAKNAILIVEFAVLGRQEGQSVWEAAVNAARLRFRPIVMTSLARSEEHTSELQSLMRNSYDVFCLKKKTKALRLHTKNKTQQ